jgi:hypothetical protein
VSIDWGAFLQVFVAALIAAVVVVGFYALGLRMLAPSGRMPVVAPVTFTDAITVLSPKQIKRAEKAAAKAAAKSPLTEAQRRLSVVAAYACFTVCALAVVAGILLIVLG